MTEPTTEDLAPGILQHLNVLAGQNKDVHWAVNLAVARAERDWYASRNGNPQVGEHLIEPSDRDIKVGGTDAE